MPAVGNPEPNGLSFKEIIEAIRIFAEKIKAIDFVEFTPLYSEMNEIYLLLAGKLIFAVIGEIIRKRI
jgi:arginase family enzyme